MSLVMRAELLKKRRNRFFLLGQLGDSLLFKSYLKNVIFYLNSLSLVAKINSNSSISNSNSKKKESKWKTLFREEEQEDSGEFSSSFQ